MDAPFLELSFLVGHDDLGRAMKRVLDARQSDSKGDATRFGELPHRPQELILESETLLIRTEGENFCGPMRQAESRLLKEGRSVFKTFVKFAEITKCIYAAILIEYRLETPSELKFLSNSLAFQDFFLSTERLPAILIQDVLDVIPSEAYVLRLDTGVYVSMSIEFNPNSAGVSGERAQEVSAKIGRILGKAEVDY